MNNNNQPPFYVGQRVVCVDDRPCSCGCGRKGLKKGRIYIILDIADTLSVKVEDETPPYYWMETRFAPIEPRRVEVLEELVKDAVPETLDVVKTKEVV